MQSEITPHESTPSRVRIACPINYRLRSSPKLGGYIYLHREVSAGYDGSLDRPLGQSLGNLELNPTVSSWKGEGVTAIRRETDTGLL